MVGEKLSDVNLIYNQCDTVQDIENGQLSFGVIESLNTLNFERS